MQDSLKWRSVPRATRVLSLSLPPAALASWAKALSLSLYRLVPASLSSCSARGEVPRRLQVTGHGPEPYLTLRTGHFLFFEKTPF